MVIVFFIKSLFRYFFLKRKKDVIIIRDLFTKFSFRYDEKQQQSFSIGLIYFRKALGYIWKPAAFTIDERKPAVLVFDSKNEEKNRRQYLQYLTTATSTYCYRGMIYGSFPITGKLVFSIGLFTLLPFFLIASLFTRNRAALFLVLLELTECRLLAQTLKNMPYVKKLILFSAFEKDVAFLSAYLMDVRGLEVQLVPSSNPLKNFYQQGICTIFTFTAAFHQSEFETLRDNWIYTAIEEWPPFGYEQVLQRLPSFNTPPAKTIGYFSSGNWLREQEGHVSLGLNERDAEKKLLHCLQAFLSDHPDYTLIVYLHPLEKRNKEVLDNTYRFYSARFGNNITYAPPDRDSLSNFDLADMGISVYSSTVFQRLFAGMKTCFAPFDMPYNYFNDDRLERISIRDSASFDETLLAFSELDCDRYFEQYNLSAYRYQHYSMLNSHIKQEQPTVKQS